jgi:phosphate transport system substrate-binding protein
MRFAGILAAAAVVVAGSAAQAAPMRDHLQVVTSAAAFGLAAEVSEAYQETFNERPPKVVRSGSGGAIAVFCGGLGARFPDVALTSRRMTDGERQRCRGNGVRRLVRAKIGYEAYAVLAPRDFPLDSLSPVALYGALGQLVADGDSLITNTRRTWNAVAAHLPERPINVIAPAANAPSWEAFVNLVLRPGCETLPAMRGLNTRERLRTCGRMRGDGRLARYRRTDSDLARTLRNQPDALAVVDLAHHARFTPEMQPLEINGVAPTIEAISAGRYVAAQPIYAYFKAQHYDHVPGFLAYVSELTSRRAIGREGYLRDAGLTPLTRAAWRAERATAIGMNPIKLTDP